MSKTPEDNPSNLFMELASDTRIHILLMLKEKDHKVADFAKEFGLTVQETHRNTTRLSDTGLIQKNGEGNFELTDFGLVIANQIPYFQFIKKNKKFFESHSVKFIPIEFTQRIGALQDCETISSVMRVLDKIKEVELGTEKFLKIMTANAWTEEGIIFYNMAEKGLETYGLLGKNTVFPKSLKEIQEKADKTRDIIQMKQRIAENVPVSVYITEKQAAVVFPHKNGQVQMDNLFVSNDKESYQWCADLFEHYWRKSRPFDSSKIEWI